jgi:peptidoglycan/LPS O-acetylase OafA/YrhL
VDRRRAPLLLLLAFLACTAGSIVVSGSRSGLDQGTAPWLLQIVGYLFALAAGVSLAAHGAGGQRRTGFVVLAAVVVLALVDAVTWGQQGANIGGGFVRLVVLLVLCAVTARLARDAAAARRPR